MRTWVIGLISLLFYSYLADARTASCVELFNSHARYSVSGPTEPIVGLKAEFDASKTNWFLAPELRTLQPSDAILESRMAQVFAYEKVRIHDVSTSYRLSRMGESGGEVTGFHRLLDTSQYSYAVPPWTQTTAKVYELEPNTTPQEDRSLWSWKGRVYIAAGNLILREPKMAEENVDAKVFVFEGEELTKVLSFSEFLISRLPDDFVTIYRAMSTEEENFWKRANFEGLIKEGQKRIDAGTAHSRFKRPGFYFSLMAPAREFSPSGRLISVRISKRDLLEMARQQLLFVGTHKTLNEVFFLPEALPTLARGIQ